MAQTAYERPGIYALEHAQPGPDEPFAESLAGQWKARAAADLGCGHGRLTRRLAAGMPDGARLYALDPVEALLEVGRRDVGDRCQGVDIEWILGDARSWRAPEPLDLILAGCGTFVHLLELDSQLEAWGRAFQNLAPGGRLVVDVPAPNYWVMADSYRVPARQDVIFDGDFSGGGGERLVRLRANDYSGDEQSLKVRYLYELFRDDGKAERVVSSYTGHVYFPREFVLLFRSAGFEVEAVWGDHGRSAFQHRSPFLIGVGRKPVT